MKIMIFGKSKSRTRTNYYYKKSFAKLGHKVGWIKFNKLSSYLGERLSLKIAQKLTRWFKPDMLFIYFTDIPPEIMEEWACKIPTVILNEDCIQGWGRMLDRLIDFAQKASLMYLTDTGELSFYRDKGVNAQFITGGCDPEAHRIVKAPSGYYRSDVAFIGKPNTPDRLEFVQEIARRFDLKLWGSGWKKHGLKTWKNNAYPSDYRQICAGARILLGWHIDATIEKYFSNRTWFTLGCGGFLLTQYSPKMEEIFQRGHHLDWFESLEECCEKIEYYLAHEEERKQVALNGYKLAHEQYSFDQLAERILCDVEKLAGKI